MEKSGVPLDRALASLQLPPPLQSRVAGLQRQIEQGRDLASAGQNTGLFTALEFSLLQAAQSAGSPARTCERLAEHYAQGVQVQQKLRSRLLLPAVVLLLALLVQPLPALVAGQLGAPSYVWGVLKPFLLLAGLGLLGRRLWAALQQPQRRTRITGAERLLLALPLAGRLYQRRNCRDYFASLALLLEAGVPMFDALPKACATLSSQQLRGEFQALQMRVLAGQPLAQALQPMDFPGKPQLASLVGSGEASGCLPAVLLGHAQRETQALAEAVDSLATWLPRLAYLLVALWMAYGLLTGGGIVSSLPAERG